jgi:hypothetical protein
MSIEKVKGGYDNISKSGHKFSKKPQSRAQAERQLGAIEAGKAREKAGKARAGKGK